MTAQEIVENLLAESPDLEKLKKQRKPLTPEENAAFDGVKLKSQGDGASKLKAVIDGETWYAVYTHRACHVSKTLKGALARLPFIASTA